MNQHIHILTGLRGLAALIVFISHAANQGLFPWFFGNGFGQIGVMLFFVLSGFLMAHLYLHKEWNRTNIKGFLFARIGRVFPLFITLVIASFVITRYLDPDFHYRINNLWVLAKALLFIQAPYEFWTIPVEVQFYTYFIFIWYVTSKSSNYLAILCLWIISLLPSLIFWFSDEKLLPFFSTYSSAFIIGIIFSYIFKKYHDSTFLHSIADKGGYLFLILIFINLPSLRLNYGLILSDDFFVRTWLDPVNWILVIGLFFCAMMNSKTLSVLNHSILSYLGKISYAFYLLHYPVLIAVKSAPVPHFLKIGIALLVVVLLSHLSGYLLESPANRFFRTLTNAKQK